MWSTVNHREIDGASAGIVLARIRAVTAYVWDERVLHAIR
jgi:hypothetical protein